MDVDLNSTLDIQFLCSSKPFLLIERSASGGEIRIKFVLLTTLILALGLAGLAQSKTVSGTEGAEQSRAHLSRKTQTIEQLAKAVAEAWSEGKLGSLDAQRPFVGSVRIRIEHSIADRVESRSFKTLARAERWLKSRERADGPGRNIGPLQQCSKGVCAFEQEGMLHNNLYLQKITYGIRKGQPYIKVIHIIDGD